jgi:hypothetical protein
MTQVPFTFGNESSPIPLSQLDANFAVTPDYAKTAGNVVNSTQANITSVGTLVALSVTGGVTAGQLTTIGAVISEGTITGNGLYTGRDVSAYGTVTGGNLLTGGRVSATGNITSSANIAAGNILISGLFSATGNVTGGNVRTSGKISATGSITSQNIISATGNIVTAANFIGNFIGNVTGNLSVGGSNTQILFNHNGNVGAVGGLTYNTDSNVLTILGTVAAQTNGEFGGNLIIDQNLSVTGNVTVGGTTQLVGLVTGPTAPSGTANNQLATTAFVSNTVGTLGTMASQNAVSVAITGGTIGNAIISLATISNTSVNYGNITNSTVDRITMSGGWTITPIGSTLYFSFAGNNVAKLDSAGNFTTKGDVTAFGSI